MHILIIPSWYPGDKFDVKGVFFRDQALALSSYGHKVGVVAVNIRSIKTIFASSANEAQLVKREDDMGVITYRDRIWAALPRVPYGHFFLWRRASEKLLHEYVEKEGWPDIIHAHSALFGGVVAAQWKYQYGLHYVLTEHSSAFAQGILRPWQLRLARRAFAAADIRLAVSPSLGKLLAGLFQHDEQHWHWIPNVVAERFSLKPNRANQPRSTVRFLNLALMTANKGQADLLAAFSRGFGSDAGAELWYGGDGPMRGWLEAESERLGIQSQVRFLGRVSPADVPELLHQVDAMVVASHYETFGVVAAEALMTGTPVVATRCGGPEGIVGEGDGLLVTPREVNELAEALKHVATHLPEYDSQAIRQRAQQRFSGDTIARELTQIYDRILVGADMTGPV